MGCFISFIKKMYLEILKNDSDKYVTYLKRKGAKIGNNVHMYDTNIDMRYVKLISIGDNVTLSGVTILAHDAALEKYVDKVKIGRVVIGNNVFIGYGSILLPGVFIGNDVIVGAGSVLRGGRIEDGCVVMGNPSKIVGKTLDFIEKNRSSIENAHCFVYLDENDFVGIENELKDIGYVGY